MANEFQRALAGAFAGGMGGGVSAFVLYPMDAIKTRIQGGDPLGTIGIARQIVREEGFFWPVECEPLA